MPPNTGAITDTSKLAAQMENLRFGEKAGSSGKRVDNGADSRHDNQVCPTIVILEVLYSPGRYFQKNWVGVCGTLPETLTLFQTKICDFPYPISDLIKNLIHYFRPDPWINTLFQAWPLNQYLCQTNVKRNVYTLLLSSIQNCTKFRVSKH